MSFTSSISYTFHFVFSPYCSQELPDSSALKWCGQKPLSGSWSLGEIYHFPNDCGVCRRIPLMRHLTFCEKPVIRLRKFPLIPGSMIKKKNHDYVAFYQMLFFSLHLLTLHVFSSLFCIVNNCYFSNVK